MLLHQKIDSLRENEVLLLTQAIADLTQLLKTESAAAHGVGAATAAPEIFGRSICRRQAPGARS